MLKTLTFMILDQNILKPVILQNKILQLAQNMKI